MIRGITKLTGKPWEDIYTELSIYGYLFGDWGNSNAVVASYQPRLYDSAMRKF